MDNKKTPNKLCARGAVFRRRYGMLLMFPKETPSLNAGPVFWLPGLPGHRAFPSFDSGMLPVPVAGYSGGSAADLHRFPNARKGVFPCLYKIIEAEDNFNIKITGGVILDPYAGMYH